MCIFCFANHGDFLQPKIHPEILGHFIIFSVKRTFFWGNFSEKSRAQPYVTSPPPGVL